MIWYWDLELEDWDSEYLDLGLDGLGLGDLVDWLIGTRWIGTWDLGLATSSIKTWDLGLGIWNFGLGTWWIGTYDLVDWDLGLRTWWLET